MTDDTKTTNARGRKTRAALLEATRAILEEQGVKALTMESVADRVGISRRGVYRHFETRSELLIALYEYVNEVEGLQESTRVVWEAENSVAALEQWAYHLVRFRTRVMAVAYAIDRARHYDADAAAHWQVVTANWYRACTRLANWLAEEHQLAAIWTTNSAADMLYALMSFDIMTLLTNDRGWSQERCSQYMAHMFHSTFVAQPSAATP